MMRKQETTAFKARVVQKLLKEEKTLAHIAAEDEVHPTQPDFLVLPASLQKGSRAR